MLRGYLDFVHNIDIRTLKFIQADLVSILDITPHPFDPKECLQRIQELDRAVREDEEKERSEDPKEQSENPQRKKRKQQNVKKNESTEQVLQRQYKAAKNIASTCLWLLNLVHINRISVTSHDEFEASHFTDYSITKREEQWLIEHSTAEAVLNEVATAYANAPKWAPFPRENLSDADKAVLESKQAAFLKELEETRKMSEILLSRTGDSATGDQHLIEYGAGNTAWIHERNVRKKAKKTSTSSTTADISDKKCYVIECEYDSIEGMCGNSSCSTIFKFCEIHLDHTSHSLHRIRELDITTTVNVIFVFFLSCI